MSKEAIAEALGQAKSVLILSHLNPDGDAVGSTLGLMWALRHRGVRAHVVLADPVPAGLLFLPGADEIDPHVPPVHYDALVVLDTSSPQHAGEVFDRAVAHTPLTVNVDHHPTNAGFGHVNWVDPTYPAVAQMVYHLLPLLKVELDRIIATCLLTGFVTDTNSFSTPNTTPALLRDAADLMEAGAPLSFIVQEAYSSRSLVQVRLWAHALQTLQYEDGIVWTVNTPQMRRAVGATERDSSDLSTFLLTIREAKIAASFTVLDDGRVKVSLRARPGYDVAKVAARFGGGGHPPAAGATLSLPPEEAIQAVISALKEQTVSRKAVGIEAEASQVESTT